MQNSLDAKWEAALKPKWKTAKARYPYWKTMKYIPWGWRRALGWKWLCLASVCMCGLNCTFLLTESTLGAKPEN